MKKIWVENDIFSMRHFLHMKKTELKFVLKLLDEMLIYEVSILCFLFMDFEQWSGKEP